MTDEYEWIGNYDGPRPESAGGEIAFALITQTAALAFKVL